MPLLVFLAMALFGGSCRDGVSIKAKRFALFDLGYAWLMINGIMVSYALGLTLQKS